MSPAGGPGRSPVRAVLLAERERQGRPLLDPLEPVERRPAQASAISPSRPAGSRPRLLGRMPVRRGPSGRRASGSGSGRRTRRSSPAGRAATHDRAPSTKIRPAPSGRSCIAARNAVVLPEPFGRGRRPPRAAEAGLDAVEDRVFADRDVDRVDGAEPVGRRDGAVGGAAIVGVRDRPARVDPDPVPALPRAPGPGRPRTAA